MQDRQLCRLQEILHQKIKIYLDSDNILPVSVTDSYYTRFCHLFYMRGATGRKRAEWYQTIIEGYVDYKTLSQIVYTDVACDQGSLGTSKRLRMRLLEGLCEAEGILECAIQAKKRMIGICSLASHRYAWMETLEPEESMRVTMMLELIAVKRNASNNLDYRCAI